MMVRGLRQETVDALVAAFGDGVDCLEVVASIPDKELEAADGIGSSQVYEIRAAIHNLLRPSDTGDPDRWRRLVRSNAKFDPKGSETPLDAITSRTASILRREFGSAVTLEELSWLSVRDVSAIAGLGKKSVYEIEDALNREFGVLLSPTDDPERKSLMMARASSERRDSRIAARAKMDDAEKLDRVTGIVRRAICRHSYDIGDYGLTGLDIRVVLSFDCGGKRLESSRLVYESGDVVEAKHDVDN